MPVYKDEERGTWYVKFAYKDLSNGKFRTKTKRGFRTCKEAKKWERENHVSEISGTDITFQEAILKYEDFMETTKDTRRKHKEHFEIRFGKFLDKKISSITTTQLSDWRQELSHTPYSTATKNTTIALVKSVFKHHCDVYGVKNPSHVLKKFKSTNEEILEEMKVWTPTEFEQFISNVDEPEFHAFFSFLFWTGCRRGEAIALQQKDVGNKLVNFRYSQTNQKDGLKPTKTKQSRYVQLDDVLWNEIQPLLSKKTPYVFGGARGLSPKSIERRWKKYTAQSGLPYIRIHDLRHSHATWLINSGVNIVAVSKRLGHANINQTLKTYTHLLETTDQGMMDKINQFRGPNHGPKNINRQ